MIADDGPFAARVAQQLDDRGDADAMRPAMEGERHRDAHAD